MLRLVQLIVLFLSLAGQSNAVVVGGKILQQNGDGRFVKLETDTGFSVGADNFDTDNLYAFDEDQNITLKSSIQVDIGGHKGRIAEGTIVASHYVFFDSLNGTHFGYVEFDAPILGIAAQQGTLAATDFLANTKVNYISTELRGLESGDRVWLDGINPKRLWVNWAGSSPGDYVRVFTERSEGALLM